ncbi:MAG: glutamate--tRNA ligase [Armatimonadetes bacterium]|nr:glutamate--tRNA ligase [Candidatus Hippobium faecium]
MKVRTRFAPSPTGSPHIGNIRTAVFDYLYAMHEGGDFILRVEDTDRTRYVESSLGDMMKGLRWMGLNWTEGPDVGGDCGPYFQSERLEIYHKYAQQLIDEGKAYYCFCTKERLEDLRAAQTAAKLPPGYDRKCRDLTPEEVAEKLKENPHPVIRFKMKREGTTEFEDAVRGHIAFQNELQDDFIAIKADGFPTYHFGSIIDDHLMKITHVIRGAEWIASAPKHIQLYEAFGWEPPIWVHPELILDEKGKKLSKRSDTVTAFMSYIDEGYLSEAMLNFMATMGWSSGEDKKLFSKNELIEKFTLDGIVNHPAIFDLPKLKDLNGEYIRMKTSEELMDMIMPYMQKAGFVSEQPSDEELPKLLEVTKLIHDRIVVLSEAPMLTEFFYKNDLEYEEKGLKRFKKDFWKEMMSHVIENLEACHDWTYTPLETSIKSTLNQMDIKVGDLMATTRMCITGRTWGPGLYECMEVIGKEESINRIRRAMEKF